MMPQRVSQAGFREIIFAIEVPNGRSCQTRPAIETLFADIPKTEDDWQRRRMDLGLSKPISIIRTFLQVVNAAAESSFTNAGNEASKAKGLLQAHGMLFQSQYLAPTRNFTVLIYWCLCRIISSTGKLSSSTIDEYMNNITLQLEAKPKGSQSLQKERTSVLWPIRIEQALRPLIGNRASEFFLLWGPPISKYRALWEQDTPERKKEFVAMVEKSCAPGAQDCTVSFSLPVLVALIGRGLFEIADVNKAFRTELSEAEFEASIYNISLQVHRIWRFSHPMPGAQDTLPEDCESAESASQQNTTQSLACIIAGFFRRLKPIAIGMLEERGTGFLCHHNSSRGDEAHTLNHDLSVGAGDGAEGNNLQETRMFGPINAGQDGGQTTSLPTNGSAASSSSQTLRAHQSDDGHPDSRSNEYQSDQSSESEFDDQTAGEAAPTRPRKRQRCSTSRGPPHSLLTPPAPQPQTQPNSQTHALNGTYRPQFGQSSSAGRPPDTSHGTGQSGLLGFQAINRGDRSEPATLLPGSDTRDRSEPGPKGFQDAVDAPQGNCAPEGSSHAATPSGQGSNLTELSVDAGTSSIFLSLVMN